MKKNIISEGILTWYDLQFEQPFKIEQENLQLAENGFDVATLRITKDGILQDFNDEYKKWLTSDIQYNNMFDLTIIDRAKLNNKPEWIFEGVK